MIKKIYTYLTQPTGSSPNNGAVKSGLIGQIVQKRI